MPRSTNGGHSTKSNKAVDLRRKDKQAELIEKLSPLEPEALKKLEEGVKEGDFRFVKLYFEYRWGKAKETKDINLDIEHNLPEWLDE